MKKRREGSVTSTGLPRLDRRGKRASLGTRCNWKMSCRRSRTPRNKRRARQPSTYSTCCTARNNRYGAILDPICVLATIRKSWIDHQTGRAVERGDIRGVLSYLSTPEHRLFVPIVMTHALSRYLPQPRYMFNPASDTPETWVCRGSAFALSAFRFMLSWHPESRQRRQRQEDLHRIPSPKAPWRATKQPHSPAAKTPNEKCRRQIGRSMRAQQQRRCRVVPDGKLYMCPHHPGRSGKICCLLVQDGRLRHRHGPVS